MRDKIKIKFREFLKEVEKELAIKEAAEDVIESKGLVYIDNHESDKYVDDFIERSQFTVEDFREYFFNHCGNIPPDKLQTMGFNIEISSAHALADTIIKTVAVMNLKRLFAEYFPVYLKPPELKMINFN